MREPRSAFVLSKIVGRRFTPAVRSYVDELLTIEKYILDGPGSMNAARGFAHLRSRHPAEFDAIEAELRPDDFRARRRELARIALEKTRQEEQARRDRLRREEEDLALWVSLGGLP